MYAMARRYRGIRPADSATDYSWLPEFAGKMAPDFVPSKMNFSGRSSDRFGWMKSDFTLAELSAALERCNNSSPGLDNVRFIHLKNLPEIGLQFLLELYNYILKSSEVPISWKHTKVIAIPKPGRDRGNADSYRPISLLSCIRKLFERMLLLRLELWAEKSEMMSNTQFVFRKGRGTADCLAIFSTEIKTAFHQKKPGGVSFFGHNWSLR